MKTKCNYCDYEKDTPVDLNLLAKAADKSTPIEDQMLFMQRLVEQAGTKDFNGVKIHMGRMHKGLFRYGENPSGSFTSEESDIINKGGFLV